MINYTKEKSLTVQKHVVSQAANMPRKSTTKSESIGTIKRIVRSMINSIPTPAIQTFRVSIPSSQVLTLNSIPVQLLAAQGAGTTIIPLSITSKLEGVTVPYATNTLLTAYVETASGPFSTNIDFLTSTTDNMGSFVFSGVDNNLQLVENQPLMISVSGGEPTDGDGDLIVYGTYRIVTL